MDETKKKEELLARIEARQKLFATATTVQYGLFHAYVIYAATKELLPLLSSAEELEQKKHVQKLQEQAITIMRIFTSSPNAATEDQIEDRVIAMIKEAEGGPSQLPILDELKIFRQKSSPAKTREEERKIALGILGVLPSAPQDTKMAKRIEMAYKWRRMANLALVLKRQKIRAVDQKEAARDKEHQIAYLGYQERDPHQLFISGGKFYHFRLTNLPRKPGPVATPNVKLGEFSAPIIPTAEGDKSLLAPFDTTNKESHGKQGYAAYVITPEGKMLFFEHFGDVSSYLHSSMNAGRAVFAAGEVRIIDGELKEITDYSGHYKPTILTIYQALKHFKNAGIKFDDLIVRTHIPYGKIPIIKEDKSGTYYKASDILTWGKFLDDPKETASRRKYYAEIEPMLSLQKTLLDDMNELIQYLSQYISGLEFHPETFIYPFWTGFHWLVTFGKEGRADYEKMTKEQITLLKEKLGKLETLQRYMLENLYFLWQAESGLLTVEEMKKLKGLVEDTEKMALEAPQTIAKNEADIETAHGRSGLLNLEPSKQKIASHLKEGYEQQHKIKKRDDELEKTHKKLKQTSPGTFKLQS